MKKEIELNLDDLVVLWYAEKIVSDKISSSTDEKTKEKYQEILTVIGDFSKRVLDSLSSDSKAEAIISKYKKMKSENIEGRIIESFRGKYKKD